MIKPYTATESIVRLKILFSASFQERALNAVQIDFWSAPHKQSVKQKKAWYMLQ